MPLLNYAIGRVRYQTFPKEHADILFYRLGQFQVRQGRFNGAIKSFSRIPKTSRVYGKAKYLQGLSYVELKQTTKALGVFQELVNARVDKGVTDGIRVAAIMGMARVHYQRKQWNDADAAYRKVPRDSIFWHDTLLDIELDFGETRTFSSGFRTFSNSAFFFL